MKYEFEVLNADESTWFKRLNIWWFKFKVTILIRICRWLHKMKSTHKAEVKSEAKE